MSLIIALAFGYLALIGALAFLMRSRRAELVLLAEDLLRDNRTYSEEQMIRMIVQMAHSLAVAPTQFLFLSAMLFAPIQLLERKALELCDENAGLFSDKRYFRLVTNYNLSVAAANPVFGALAMLVRALVGVKVRLYASRHPESAKALRTFKKCTV